MGGGGPDHLDTIRNYATELYNWNSNIINSS